MKTKLQECIQSLSKKERGQLAKKVSAIARERQDAPHLLLLYWIEKVGKKGDADASKEKLFAASFGTEQTFSDVKLRHAQSGALQLVEEFLVELELKNHKDLYDLQLLVSYGRRGLSKHFSQVRKRLEKRRRTEKGACPDSYHAEFLYHHYGNKFIDQQQIRFKDFQIGNSVASIDRYYLCRKLKLTNELLNLRQVATVDFENPFAEELIERLPDSQYYEDDLIRLHYLVYHTLKFPEREEHFQALKDCLESCQSTIKEQEVREIYFFAFNYCTRKINNARLDYFQELFELYKLSLEEDIILDNGLISPWNYKNIVTVALRLQEYDWVYDFLHQYRFKMDMKEAENAYHFNLATYYFHIKNWNKVLLLLQKVSFSDIFYGLDTRALQLKLYFEQGEQDALYSKIESFRKVLRRKTIIGERHRQNYSNLIKYVRQLSNINPRDKKKLQKFLSKVSENKQVADKGWLLQKIRQRLD